MAHDSSLHLYYFGCSVSLSDERSQSLAPRIPHVDSESVTQRLELSLRIPDHPSTFH